MWGRLMFVLAALVAVRPPLALAQSPDPAPPAPPASPSPSDPPAPPPGDAAPTAPSTVEPDDAALGPPLGDTASEAEPALHEDDEFGPVIQIEQIDITGNTATRGEVIRRALRLGAGDVLHASDRRLRDARFKVLALGFFRDVQLAIHKGSQRGQVVIEVRVVERGTVVLNRLWFGTTTLSPWWLGTDVGERNLLGLGIAVGAGFLFARHGDVPGARDQYAAELRAAQPSLGGTRWGASAALTAVHGSEPFRISGAPDDAAADTQQAFPYRRLAARVAATYNLSALTRLSFGLRGEVIDSVAPAAPIRTLPDGSQIAVDLHLDPGTSRVVTASIGFDRDTRPDPILPHAGDLVVAAAELGTTTLGGSYDFATIFGRYEHYWPVGDHQALAIKLSGGIVVGDAPRFDRIHISDVDHMLAPRALGVVLSTSAPLAILGTRADKPTYGDLGGSATAEYVFQLFRGRDKRRVYGGDVFVGAGLWGLAERADLRVRDTSLSSALPIDLYLDAGVRLDTDVGIFELTVANALGRLR